MTDLLFSLRGVLFVEGFAVTMIYAWIAGTKAFDGKHGWSYRITSLGFFGVLTYLTAVQVKAYTRNSPFDGYSWFGLTFVTVLMVGLLAYLWTRDDSTDGA